jgi:ATP-dependent Clp protease ATP-binding subunit ClpA
MLDRSAMFERFTDRARRSVVNAQEEARRLQHNYIGTEHILLGLLAEQGGVAARALERFGVTLEGTRDEVKAIIGLGKAEPKGHIPFTPRAKKTLELAVSESRRLQHKYIGTEHVLLGVIREGSGVGAQILKQHCSDLLEIRMAVLDLVAALPIETVRSSRWLRRRELTGLEVEVEPGESAEMRTTPAADVSLTEAARLAGSQPVGSHHLLLAAIADADTAAARTLVTLGLDLDLAREALRNADVTGTSDEQPAEAGRRRMVIKVTGSQVAVEVTDPVIVGLGQAALSALGDEAGVIRGDLPVSASLSNVWQALHDSLAAIQRHASTPAAESRDDADKPATDAGSSGVRHKRGKGDLPQAGGA